MERCATCRHWGFNADEEKYEVMRLDEEFAYVSDEDLPPPPFEIRKCLAPGLAILDRPRSDNGASVMDGSRYRAALFTALNYGCVLHEPVE